MSKDHELQILKQFLLIGRTNIFRRFLNECTTYIQLAPSPEMPTRGQIIVKMGLYLLFKAIYFLEIKIKSILDVYRWIVKYIFINKSVLLKISSWHHPLKGHMGLNLKKYWISSSFIFFYLKLFIFWKLQFKLL